MPFPFASDYLVMKNTSSLAAFYDDIVFWEIATNRNRFYVTFEKGLHSLQNNQQESIGTMEISYPHVTNTTGSTASFDTGLERENARYDAFLQKEELVTSGGINMPSRQQYNGYITMTELRGNKHFQTTLTASNRATRSFSYEIYGGNDTGSVNSTRTVDCAYFYPFSSHQLSVLRPNSTLIVDMDKESELFDGIGEKGFVVVPQDTHQKIRDNITFYLHKAGLIEASPRNKSTLFTRPRNK